MATPELDKLIVDHLADLDAAAIRLTDLGGEVCDKIDEAAAEWAGEKRWLGNFDFMQKRPTPRGIGPGLWFAPPDWLMPGTPVASLDFQAWFELKWDDTKIGDQFELTSLCGEGVQQAGFRFGFSDQLIRRRSLRALFRSASFVDLLKETPFSVDSIPSFFFPIKLDSSTLGKCFLEGDIESALVPFEEVLASIAAAKPAFDAVIAEVKRLALVQPLSTSPGDLSSPAVSELVANHDA
jgi:hypothetical protein